MINDGCTNNIIDEYYKCNEDALGKSTCVLQPCGDGVIINNEECDDANYEKNDGCTDCLIEEGWECPDNKCSVIYGDGIRIKDFEECDDGNLINFDGCSSEMKLEPGFDCYSKFDNQSFPEGVKSDSDTYCEMQTSTTMSAGS